MDLSIISFNLNLLECKLTLEAGSTSGKTSFNLNLLECK